MSTNIDTDEVMMHVLDAYTLGELLAFYRPESSPDTKHFGNIYTNTGFMIKNHMDAARKIIEGEPDA